MKKADLRAALDSIQVKKPLRLSSGAPAFTAPPTPVENPTQVGNQTQVRKESEVAEPTSVESNTVAGNPTPVEFHTQVANPTQAGNLTQAERNTPVAKPTQVENSTEVAIQTEVQNQTLVAKLTSVEIPTQGKPQTEVQYTTQVENPTGVASLTKARSVTEQDSSVVLEAHAIDKLKRGYTRVPNEILMKLVSEDFTRNEIKLALLVARFTISFQRAKAPLSKSVIERRTGLRGPAVLDALAGLVAKGLVEKEQGDQNRPNRLGLALPPDWDCPKKPESTHETFLTPYIVSS